MMFRTTQCAAPLAFLLLFAGGSAFVGTIAEAAVGFVEPRPQWSGRHLRLESSRPCRGAMPPRNARPPRRPFTAEVRV